MRFFVLISICIIIFSSCSGHKDILREEIIYKDGRITYKIHVHDLNISELPKEFAVLQDPRSGHWSVSFYDLDKKETVFEYNANKNLLPASNLKLVTTAAALKLLGTDYRFETDFFIDGHIDRRLNLLKGNLYILGSGDPSTAGDFLRNRRSLQIFAPLVDSLKKVHGIDFIEGRIIPLNPFRFEKAFGKGWDIDDITHYYSAAVSPLTFHENLTRVRVNNGRVTVIPPYSFNVRLDTIPDLTRNRFNRVIGSDSLIISSNFNRAVSGFVTVNDPDRFYIDNLKAYLSDNGIRVQDRDIQPSGAKYHLATIKSDSLYAMLHKCNGESNNLYSEQIFRKIAETFSSDSSFADSLGNFPSRTDIVRVNSALYERLFGINNFNLADGSGLSRMNFFSSSKFIRVLETMYHDKNFLIYLSSFPLPGTEGTLQSRMNHPSLNNRLFAKTGSMTGVNCLTGYIYTEKGTRLAFSILNNYYNFGRNRTFAFYEDMLVYFAENY